MPLLLLASTSPARRSLMDALGLPYRAVSPGVDENVPPGTLPIDAVRLLARRKARAVFEKHPEALVLGADQLGEIDGETLGKPADAAAARSQLSRLRGRTHALHTGVCLLGPRFEETVVETAHLTFHAVADRELDAYVATGEWEGCAGGYRIESKGQLLLQRFDGDRTNIQGLPMSSVVTLLRKAGVDFWSPDLGG